MKCFIKTVSSFALIVSSLFLFQSCSNNDEPKKEELVAITGISPESGTAETTVVITGSGFSSTLANNLVTLNDKECSVTDATITQLTIKIPTDAGSGKIKVTVNGKVAESSLFTYTNSSNSSCSQDISFDSDGVVATAITGSEPDNGQSVNANAIQADGKLIVIGESIQSNGERPYVIIRYNTNGSVDTSWGGDGQVVTGLTTDYEYAFAKSLAIQPDNKIIVVGEVKRLNLSPDMIIVRYLSDGTLDNTFDSDGILVHSPPVVDYSGSHASGIAVQPDGKIIVSGNYDQYNKSSSAIVIRLNANGSLDSSFDGDGSQNINFGSSETNSILTDAKIQLDGKIVVSGFAETNFATAMAIARLNTNGSFDTSFGSAGKQTTKIFPKQNRSYTSAIQPDGKIILSGYMQSDGFVNSIGAMVRYNADGSLDNSFGTQGSMRDVLVGIFQDFVLLPNGKIVICVGSYIARYNSDGTPDNTFCNKNYFLKNPDTNASLQTISLQADNSMIASGLYRQESASGTRSYLYYSVRHFN